MQNRVYRYPDVWVCLYDFYGCDSQPFEEKCIRSIHATEGGKTRARYHPNGANHQELKIAPVLTDKVTASAWQFTFDHRTHLCRVAHSNLFWYYNTVLGACILHHEILNAIHATKLTLE